MVEILFGTSLICVVGLASYVLLHTTNPKVHVRPDNGYITNSVCKTNVESIRIMIKEQHEMEMKVLENMQNQMDKMESRIFSIVRERGSR